MKRAGLKFEQTAAGWRAILTKQSFTNEKDVREGSMPKANEKQIGGDHYKENVIQPWDFIVSNNLGFLEGSAIKYISRYKSKGGVEDLHKAIHFIEKLIEVEEEKKQKGDGLYLGIPTQRNIGQ